MDNIGPILANLEMVELQILGSLFKINSNTTNVNEGVKDLETTARRLKGMVKSLQCKVGAAKQEVDTIRKESSQMKVLKEENATLKRKLVESEAKNRQQKERITTLQENLTDSQCLMASFEAE